MTQEEKAKAKIVCPNCKKVLNDEDYDTHTVYHNCEEGICKLCGYESHWSDFLNEIKEK